MSKVDTMQPRGNCRIVRLGHRTPATWRAWILALPEAVQTAAARVIWWDFFSSRLTGERWDHLDDLIDERREDWSTVPELQTALVELGYTPEQAQRRLESSLHEKYQPRPRRWRSRPGYWTRTRRSYRGVKL